MASKLLDRAIKQAESLAGLARALNVSPSTVRRWKTSLPKEREADLRGFAKLEKERGTKQRVDRQKFLELMKVAGSSDLLPDIKSHEKLRAGRLTSGYDYTRRFSEMLTLGLIDRIEVWVRGLKKRFPDWQLVAVVSEYGRGEHKGYKTVYRQIAPEAGDFAISAELATPRVHSAIAAMVLLREQLEGVAKDVTVLTFVHAVTAFNYRLRTDEESSSWETQQRRKREKKKPKPAVRGWGHHWDNLKDSAWPLKKTKASKTSSAKPKKRKTKTPTTTRLSASRRSLSKPAVVTKPRSKPALKKQKLVVSSSKSKRSSKATAKTISTKKTPIKSPGQATRKILRTPAKKTTLRTSTKKAKKSQSKKRNR